MDIQEYIKSGAIESYVLGVADENDVAELQQLKVLHPEIATAIDTCERWLEEYARAHAVPVKKPAPSVKKLTPSVRSLGAVNRGFSRYLVAASLFLVIVSAGSGYYFYRQYEKAVANYAILADPEIVKVSLQGVPGKENNRATLYWNPKTKDVYLQPDHLLPAPAGKQYQLWALVDGKPIDAGLLENGEGLCRLKPVEKAQAFAITLEKAGGSPTPTPGEMYVLGNVKS